jgi:hypothetical protein
MAKANTLILLDVNSHTKMAPDIGDFAFPDDKHTPARRLQSRDAATRSLFSASFGSQ